VHLSSLKEDMNYVNSKIRVAFGKKVRLLRHTRELTQEKLAELADLHRTYISSIERGEQSVSIDNAAKIAKVLKVSLAELFEGL
jgi:transcriptional regulator with XRE-family HTH domain